MRILVIDDDTFIANDITDELTQRGHDAKARYMITRASFLLS